MAKVKKAFFKIILLLLTVLMCMPFVACGNEQSQGGQGNDAADGNEGIEPLGLYTDLQFSLNGENGQVRASVKNKFTLFPSTVTVNIELYRSYTYQEDYKKMTLAASNYIYDLDQGKTVSAIASTDGKASYWKARAYYRVDNKSWKENLSDTVYLNGDGIKTTVSTSVPEDKDYFVSDFLQAAPVMEANIPYVFGDDENKYKVISTATAFLDNDDLLSVKNTLGEVKLKLYDKKSDEMKAYRAAIITCPAYSLYLKYGNDNAVRIMVKDDFQNELGANLFVDYDNNGNYKCFMALLSDETKTSLIESAKNMYENKKGENK